MLRLTLLLVLGCLFLGACSVAEGMRSGWSDSEQARAASKEWKSKTLDELIFALPDVDRERWRDPEGEGFVTHPAVEELRRRMDAGVKLADDQWLRALIGSGVIRWRTSWPEGEPFAISLRMPSWADIPRIRVVPRHPDLTEVTCGLRFAMCGLAHDGDAQRAYHSRLGLLALGHHELELDVVLEARDWGLESKKPALWEGRLTFKVDVVPSLDAILQPRSTPELQAALRDLLRLERLSKETTRVRLLLGDVPASRAALAKTALAFEIDLLRAGAVLESHPPTEPEYRWMNFGPQDLPPPFHHLALLEHLPARGEDLAGYTLRLRGVERDALRWWGTDQRFAGTLEIPLVELLFP